MERNLCFDWIISFSLCRSQLDIQKISRLLFCIHISSIMIKLDDIVFISYHLGNNRHTYIVFFFLLFIPFYQWIFFKQTNLSIKEVVLIFSILSRLRHYSLRFLCMFGLFPKIFDFCPKKLLKRADFNCEKKYCLLCDFAVLESCFHLVCRSANLPYTPPPPFPSLNYWYITSPPLQPPSPL